MFVRVFLKFFGFAHIPAVVGYGTLPTTS